MKKLCILTGIMMAVAAHGQVSNPSVISVPSTPTSCGTLPLKVVANSNSLYGSDGAGGCAAIGGGASGFPIVLGSTSIASGSTTTAVTGLTIDGVTPTTMGFVDPTSSIQTQLNSKAASNASTTVNGQTCTLGSTCTIAVGAMTNIGGAVTWAMGSGSGSFSGSTFVVGTAGSSITISGIPGTYTHLHIRITGQQSAAGSSDLAAQFNADSGSNYDWAFIATGNTTPGTGNTNGTTLIHFANFASSGLTGKPGMVTMDVNNYANTTWYKSITSLSSSPVDSTHWQEVTYSGDWHNTAAITSITLTVPGPNNFVAGTIVSIYGIN